MPFLTFYTFGVFLWPFGPFWPSVPNYWIRYQKVRLCFYCNLSNVSKKCKKCKIWGKNSLNSCWSAPCCNQYLKTTVAYWYVHTGPFSLPTWMYSTHRTLLPTYCTWGYALDPVTYLSIHTRPCSPLVIKIINVSNFN